jgi:quinol monooxygenase YgiN
VTVEAWRSSEAIERHFEMSYVMDLVEQAPDLFAAEPVLQTFTRL